MKRNEKRRIDWLSIAITIIASTLVFTLTNYLFIPRIGWSFGFLFTIAISLLIGALVTGAINLARDEFGHNHARVHNTSAYIAAILAAILLIAILVSWVVSWRMFHVDDIKNRLDMTTITQEELVEMLPDVDEDGAYSWADSATARKLAARKTGELTELISIFTVSGTCHTSIVDGDLIKYVPMEYAGLMKAMQTDNIPGYVSVNPVKQNAEYVEHAIRYSPSAFFANDLMRHARRNFPHEYFGRYTFQVSPEGNPTWVLELERTCNSWTVREVYAVALIDAETGACTKYILDEAPEWVSCIHGDTAQEIYNGYGRMINGFWNLSGVGTTATTNDFGYVAIDGEMYYTTGVTSAVNDGGDESNLGILLYNAHTNKAYYCQVAGAEEYSAMEAAEGAVQNFGYEAAFPSLTNVNDELTYVMVLKDSNGIVKQYGMVNYNNYTVVVTADTLGACRIAYNKAMSKSGVVVDDAVMSDTITITVDAIEYIVQGGETTVYLRDIENNVYKADFSESFLFMKAEDVVTLYILDNTANIAVVAPMQ